MTRRLGPALAGPAEGVRRRAPRNRVEQGYAGWPPLLRPVRAWLDPRLSLARWWRAWSSRPPPHPPGELIEAVASGRRLDLSLRAQPSAIRPNST